jgi:hypothetical protein
MTSHSSTKTITTLTVAASKAQLLVQKRDIFNNNLVYLNYQIYTVHYILSNTEI